MVAFCNADSKCGLAVKGMGRALQIWVCFSSVSNLLTLLRSDHLIFLGLDSPIHNVNVLLAFYHLSPVFLTVQFHNVQFCDKFSLN